MTFDGQEHDSYEIAILVPRLDEEEIRRRYIDPLGVDISSVVAVTIDYGNSKKTPVKEQKAYFDTLLPMLHNISVSYIMCCDADFFKTLAKLPKAEAYLGYVVPANCDSAKSIGYSPKVIYSPSYTGAFYDPDKIYQKISQSVQALKDHIDDSYTNPGDGIIKFAAYPEGYDSIKVWLQRLLDMDCDLTCDIEGFSLKHTSAGIGSIAFAWNQNEGVAFSIDYKALADMNEDKEYGEFILDRDIHDLLAEFFRVFKHKLIFHNISFDVTVLIYQLYMKDILDTSGLLDGLDIMLKNWDDTKLISYLATNSCAGNKLGLKEQAQEFAGNYAVEEIKDIKRIPKQKLLQYNLVDALSTWYVYHKRQPQMVADNQLNIYEELFKPAIVDIIQMQLTGLPVDMQAVGKARAELESDTNRAINKMMSQPIIQRYIQIRNEQWVQDYNTTRKVKRVTLADAKEVFNPNSDKQLQEFLFELHNLPVLDRTDSKQPATGAETLKKLLNHTSDPEMLSFLEALIDYKAVIIILTTFIPAFERAVLGPDGWHYLFGNFNLGGTVSGRLSSSDPNLQNIPSNGSDKTKQRYAKIIKTCVKAPLGWLFVGLDFDSLEDRISALTTKDPNKLKVYTDGYDGHCLRAFFYFANQMPGITEDVKLINSIKDLFPELRQESKAPTFALTYQGTYHTLMNNCGFSTDKAMDIESKYRLAYKVSIDWVDEKLDSATKLGYVEAAFGLKVRTPLLKQVIRGTKRTPYEASAEGRTAGNALGQSWCLLNTRAGIEFMRKVRLSKYRLTIRPSCHIHDAQYYIVHDDIPTFLFVNEHLVIAAKWQNHPDIYHPDVKLGGSTSIFYPNWAHEMSVKNGVDSSKLIETIDKHIQKLKDKGVL
jgi:DNA polymerase-1